MVADAQEEAGAVLPIVVGVDGSPASDRAVAWAVDEARRRGAPLSLIYGWSYDDPPDTLETFEAHGAAVVARAGQAIGDRGLTVTTSVVPLAPAQALVEASGNAQLLVVGSRGRGGFAGLLLGSVSQQCALHAQCPTVIVRQ